MDAVKGVDCELSFTKGRIRICEERGEGLVEA